jgi:hypothetical protein
VDLNDKNAAKFEKAVAPFVQAARTVTSGHRSSRRGRSSRSAGRRDTQAIRAWAQKNGYQVNARGRISRRIVEAYQSTR